MKKRFLLSIISILIFILTNAQTWSWIKRGPGQKGANIHGIAITLDKFYNHILITGVDSFHYGYNQPISFYVAKYDNLGNLLWQREFEGTKYAYDIETDSRGNIYFLSERFNSIDNKPVSITSPFCLVKLDPNGRYIWAAPISFLNKGNIHEYLFHKPVLKVDPYDNFFFAASIYTENFQFLDSTFNYPAVSSGDVFVARFDTAGKVKWTRRFIVGNGYDMYAGGVFDIDMSSSDGVLALAGFFDAVIDVNGQTLSGIRGSSNPLGRTPFLAVLNQTNGTTVFTKIYTSDYTNNYITGVILKNHKNLISRARVRGGILMLSSGSVLPGGTDMVFTDSTGKDLSYKQMYPGVNYHGFDFGQDSSGNIYSSCYVSNANTSTQNDSFNIRIQKYDPSGNFLYHTQINNLNIYGPSYSYFKLRDNVLAVTGSVIPRYGYLQVGNNVIDAGKDSISTFVGSIIEQNDVITGKLFFDSNGNGIQDTAEKGLPNRMIVSQPGFDLGYTFPDGNYRIYADTGASTISVLNIPRYHTCTPKSYSVNFSDYGQSQDGKDFALSIIPNINDLFIDITPFNAARRGSQIFYFITYANTGTTTLSGNIGFEFTDTIDFISTNTPYSFLNSDSIGWSYSDLKPGEVRYIIATFKIRPTTAIGPIFRQYVHIYPILNDTLPSDNIDSVLLRLLGPFDPNDKLVDPGLPLVLDSVKANKQFVEYTIRFQNTGTDTAFQVRVLDTVSAKLDLNSFELLASSHLCQVSYKKPGVLEFYFPNILLPDSNKNEFASHGFVKYRIKPITSVSISDTIYNSASIYFDYNSPVKTNIDSTVFRTTVITGINNLPVNSKDLKLYPNPAAQGMVYKLKSSTRQELTLRIYDISGRLLYSSQIYTTVPGTTGYINTEFLRQGIYILELTGKKMRYQKSFIKL